MPPHVGYDPLVRSENEAKLGITQHASKLDISWTGDTRKRYSDFLVHEIDKSGAVLRLENWDEERQQTKPQVKERDQQARRVSRTETKPRAVEGISEKDFKILADMVGDEIARKLVDLDVNLRNKVKIDNDDRSVTFPAMEDRHKRTMAHQEIRRIFDFRFDTSADPSGVITAVPAHPSSRNGRYSYQRPSNGQFPRKNDGRGIRDSTWNDLGGEYLHFILYKENKDTMDAINNIARMIKTKASSFGFAGTKDRRAATVQRVSIRRQRASNLSWLNTRLTGVRLSGFKHQKSPIQLGHLSGNLFHITLKNCHTSGDEKWSLNKRFPLVREAVQRGLANLKKYGYINYFGLQRFGTYSVGTHILGMKILQGDFEAVINDILHVDEHLVEQIVNNTAPIFENSDVNNTNLTSNADRNTRDELNRARALLTWKSTKNSAKALAHLPKRFSSEYSIIQHLGRETAERDFMGALRSITRGMRMMYCHAFQSFVWNHVASYRWSKYGSKVIVGDLVLVDDDLPRLSPDEDGDRESNSDEEQFYASARSLTQEEVASGKHSIFDVVLPQPGFDMVYPPNDVGDFYVEFMARPENGGIDPYNMRRVHKEFSLSGNYRHLMGRFMDEPEYALRVYTDDTEQMYPTDLDFCTQAKTDAKAKADSARAATRDRWANFSTLDAQYNALHAENRRRQAEERPMESVSRISQVWRQTGLDGDNKRVRIAKTRFESELPVSRVETDTGNHGSSLPAEEKSKAEEEVSVKAEVSVKVEETAPVLPAPPAASEPTAASISPAVDPTGTIKHYTPSSDSIGPSSAPVQTPGLPFGRPLGVHQAVQVLDGKGLSDVFYEKGTNHNSETEGAPAAQSDVAQLDTAEIVKNETVQTVDTESRAIKSDPDPAFDVVFNNGATSTQADQASESTTHEDSGKSQQVVNGIKLPVFFKAPDDPSAAIVDDGMSPLDFGSGNKIAVTLKFKLRSSNYATVVLRELQGLE